MFYGNYLSNKYQQIRKRSWSAPMIMSVFIIFSMLLVFSFEQVGLFRKESNLNYATKQIGRSK